MTGDVRAPRTKTNSATNRLVRDLISTAKEHGDTHEDVFYDLLRSMLYVGSRRDQDIPMTLNELLDSATFAHYSEHLSGPTGWEPIFSFS